MFISFLLFVVIKELFELIQVIVECIVDIIDVVIFVIGVGVGVGVVVVIVWDIGNIILVVFKFVVQIVYVILMVIVIVDLMNQLFEQFMLCFRYYKGILIRLFFECFCNYFGLIFQFVLLDNLDQFLVKWCYIFFKNNKGGDRLLGVFSGWKEIGLLVVNLMLDIFVGVICVFKEMFNVDFFIEDGVFRFECKD